MNNAEHVILNIDDDEPGRHLLSRYLQKAGFQVVEAANGTDGIRMAIEQQPDLILLDIQLPDLNGFEVCRRLRENPLTAGVPILQLSAAYRDEASRAQSLEVGANAFLEKPVERVRLLATVNSLLRLRAAEEQVRNTAAEWITTFDAIQDGVALLDKTGKVIRANKRYFALAGSKNLECGPLFDKLRATSHRQYEEQSAGDIVLEYRLDPVLNSGGDFNGAVCTVSDVTSRKRFDERLQHAQKLESIGVLAGGIAHDFNNLLTGILGNASLLVDELPSQSSSYEMAQEIVKASESAADLTRQLLAYAGKGRFVMQVLDLSEQISNNQALLARLIPPNIQLEFHLAPHLPALEADASQLQQIVMNLVLNSAESYGERGKGKVVITTAAQFIPPGDPEIETGSYAMLSVADSGSGMSPEVRARIFDPFFTTKFTGRGLGLSAVHGIIRAHRGHMRLETEPGIGTTFRLYLPASFHELPAPAVVSNPALNPGEGAVLVIDDEATVRTFADAALSKMGYRVLLAENGQAGLDLVKQAHAELSAVILDFAMPIMDGEEALEQIRKIAPDLTVILSTGFHMTSEYDRLVEKGASAFLPKPFTAAQLSAALHKA